MSDWPSERFVTLVEALAIHADQIERHGGAPGIRDLGALESTLYRPQTGYYADPIQEAAALWESLSQNHPFVDGNKPVAFAVTDVFLRLNGMRISGDPLRIYDQSMALHRDGRFAFAELEIWLRKNAVDMRTR